MVRNYILRSHAITESMKMLLKCVYRVTITTLKVELNKLSLGTTDTMEKEKKEKFKNYQ